MTTSVIICVSDQELYRKALGASLDRDHGEPVEVISIDNTANKFSAPQALNLGADHACGEILVFLHQDVVLPADWFHKLRDQIRIVEKSRGTWGVLGPFGVSIRGGMVGHIKDPHGYRKWGRLPCRVQSLDEVCLVVRRGGALRFDETIGGFHFYGADLCLQAQRRGMSCYAIDALLEHLSAGKAEGQFWEVARRFEEKWKAISGGPDVVETTCGIFRTGEGLKAVCAELIARLRRKAWRRWRRVTGFRPDGAIS
jgi:hypothetical protein